MGCSTLFIIVWIAFMLAFWGLIRLNQNLFYVPPQKRVLTSRVAARRCQQKLEIFKTNANIKSILLNELEINSAFHHEFAQGKYQPLLSVTVEMKPERLVIESTVVLVELIPKKIRAILDSGFGEEKGKGEEERKKEEEERRKAVIKIISQPVISQRGQLFLNPQELVIGRQKIPAFIIRFIHKMKPELFNYPISQKIKAIKVKEHELELVKW
jgi:hypothetical protein